MLRRRFAKRKREAETAAGDADEQWEAQAAAVDDTLTSVQLLVERHAQSFERIRVAPLALWHQLYSVFPNKTFVDQNVSRLRSNGQLVTFPVSPGSSDTAVMTTDGYLREVDEWIRVFRAQDSSGEDAGISDKVEALKAFRGAIPTLCKLPTISMDALIDSLDCSSDVDAVRQRVRRIQHLGFLLPTARLGDETFHFTVPGVGKIASALKKTRSTILGVLKRTRYKEVQEAQLKQLKLKHSPFKMEFHLTDMEGLRLLRRTKVTSGTLVTLQDD